MQRPIMGALKAHACQRKLVYLNPVEPFNLYLKDCRAGRSFPDFSLLCSIRFGCSSSPGLYPQREALCDALMASTIALFSAGGYFGYKVCLSPGPRFPDRFRSQFQPMITIGEYTSLFLSIVLGMGLIFELPILIFFSGADGHRERPVHVEELPVFHPGHFYHCGQSLPRLPTS